MTEQSTEIAVVDERPPTPRNPGTITAGAMPRPLIPQDFEGAWRIATAVCTAEMAPKGLDTAAKATVAILHGLEVGLTPMAALQSIAIVNGRPSIWGDGALALVRASGLLEDFEEVVEGTGDERVARCVARRKGQRSPIMYEFSVDDAKRAELWQTEPMVTRNGRNGVYTVKNDSPWYRYGRRMLQMRARAFVLRDGFADVLRGLHIREEQEDVVRASSTAVLDALPAEAQPARRVAPPPPADEPEATETAPATGQAILAAQQGASSVMDTVLQPATDAVNAMIDKHEKAKPAPSGDAGDIPESLRRTKPKPAAEPEPEPEPEPARVVLTDEERDWLEGLAGAFSGAGDVEDLQAEFQRLVDPYTDKFSPPAVAKAIDLYNEYVDQVGN